MKKFTEMRIIKKISLVFIIFVLLFQFMMPIKSNAIELVDTELPSVGDIFRYMAQIVAGGGDLAMSALNNFFLGTSGFGTAMIDSDALGNGSWFDNDGLTDEYNSDVFKDDSIVIGEDDSKRNIVIYVEKDSIENNIIAGSENWEVPNLLYCPENIFGNNIAMLDVNFLNPNEYEQVLESQKGSSPVNEKKSIAGQLKNTIVSWYRSFRNLAIVALLSILVYLGIRILISSTAEDKAKYKQAIRDWVIALCLVFLMHFIMSAVIMIVNQINTLFQNVNSSIYVNYGGTIFQTNFTGAIRFLAQSSSTGNAWIYTIIYLVLIGYTGIFTIQYLKRVLYIAFYTMIAPLVAITYPLDKFGDGKSQAFNQWFKEYIMTMALQPIHLIIYSMIVSSALSLSLENPLYALVAIGFLIPAEKFIRSLFGVDSKADSGFGTFAGGALTMQALNALRKPKFGGPNGKGGKGGKDDSSGGDEEDSKIRQVNNKELDHWKNDAANSNANNPNTEENKVNNDTNEPNEEGNSPRQDNQNNNTGDGQDNQNDNTGDTQDTTSGNNYANSGDNQESRDDSNANKKYKNIRRMRRNQWAKNNGKRAIKGVAKGIWKGTKFAAKGMGAVSFGAVGLASGIASGKGIGEAVKRAGIGVGAGIAAGTTLTNITERVAGGTIKGVKREREAVHRYQMNKAKDMSNAGLNTKKYEQKISLGRFAPYKAQNKAKYNQMIDDYAIKKGRQIKGKERNKLIEKMYDYAENYGVTDKDKIFKGIELEKQYQDRFGDKTHEKIADIMQLTNTYGRQYITDKKKYEEFNNNLEAHGITGQNKEDIIELFHAANDAKYKRPGNRTEKSNSK